MQSLFVPVPEKFPRRILMAVTGKTPQIVTETLWALAVGRETPFIPTEIRVMTTEEGKRHLVGKLLAPESGAFHRLCQEWGLSGIHFDESCIEVLRDHDGALMEDILTPADNECAANCITHWVRIATQDKDAALHVSLAGGRKTMGYYVGYALSLFGRPQDRLSHVLVDAAYERMTGEPAFYYPTKQAHYVFTHDKKDSADAAKAIVHLAPIPFVPLAKGLPKGILEGKLTFSATVEAAEKALASPYLQLDFRRRSVICGDKEVQMEPAAFAFYAWLAVRRKELGDHAGVTWSEAGWGDNEFREEYTGYLETYARMRRWEIDMRIATDPYRNECMDLSGGFGKSSWELRINAIKKTLMEALDYGAEPYLVGSLGKQGSGRNARSLRGLTVPPDCIHWTDRKPPGNFRLPLPSSNR